jgi:outer membrane protein
MKHNEYKKLISVRFPKKGDAVPLNVIASGVLTPRSNLTKLKDYFGHAALASLPRNDAVLHFLVSVLLAVLTLFPFNKTVYADDDQALSLKQCVDIALKQQPSLRASSAVTDVNRGILTQVRSAWYPWISAQGGYTRETNNYVFPPAFSHFIPPGATTPESNTSYDYYTAAVGFNWLLMNFGQRLYSIRAQQQAVKSSQYNEQTTKADVIFNVTQAYYGLLAAQHMSGVAAEVLSESSKHLEQAQGFLSVGRVSRIDVARAETDRADAQLNMITAASNVELAMVNLLNTMGVKDTDTVTILDTVTPATGGTALADQFPGPADVSTAVQSAMDNRPELKSLYAAKEGIEASEKATLASNMPSIIGTGGYSWAGYNTPLTWNWAIGVGVQFPLFSGFSTYGKYRELKASQQNVEAQTDALKQGIVFQVKQANLDLHQAKDSISAAKKAMDSAQLNLELAEERYATGAGSIIELTDSETLYASASTQYIQALYQYNVAFTQLQRAEGVIAEGY